MKKLLLLFASFGLFAPLAFAQAEPPVQPTQPATPAQKDEPPKLVTIYELKRNQEEPSKIRDSFIISTESGLRFEFNSLAAAGLRKGMTDDEKKQQKVLIDTLSIIADAADEGLKALPALARAVDALAPGQVLPLGMESEAIAHLKNAVTKGVDASRSDPELRQKIIAAIVTDGDTSGRTYMANLTRVFRVLQDYVREKADLLVMDLFAGKITIHHMRSNDMSRSFDTDMAAGLSAEEQGVFDKLKKLYTSLGNGNPDELKKSLLEKIRKAADEQLDELRSEADQLKGAVQDEIDQLKVWLESQVDSDDPNSPKKRVARLVASFEDFQKVVKELEQHYSDATLSTTADANAVVSDINRLAAAVATVKAEIAGVGTPPIGNPVDELVQKISTAWANVQGRLTNFLETLKTSIGKVAEAIAATLNLVDTLVEIGSTSGDIGPGKDAVFVNQAGTLEGLSSPLKSGDELVVDVVIQSKPDGEEIYKASYTIYVYKEGLRQDRIFNLILAPKEDNNRWNLYPSYTQVFKRANFDNLGANRDGSIGLGLTFATLDQNSDDSFELGVGLGLTFLDDRLMAGFGRNFSLDRNFWYVGWRFRLD
jgi:hypothetical protein